MSNTNPYYRSAAQSDEQFAQQASQNSHRPQNAYHSAYDSRTEINYKKPYFPQNNYPSVSSYIPPPPPPPRQQQQNPNYFTQIMDKYKTKKRATDLTQMSFCPNCNQMSQSFIVKKNSFIVWILCIILLAATYVCFFLPFLFDALKNKHVVCKNCGKQKFVVKVW